MGSYDILVIGGGMAGLTAASNAAAGGRNTALLEPSPMFGGQIANVEAVEGLSAPMPGMMLAMNAMQDCVTNGVETIAAGADAVTREEHGFEVATAEGVQSAAAVILASGARLKTLGVAGEAEFEGRGVSQCASCDGPLFQGQDVAVVGGGDAAAQEALALAGFCRSVHLLTRTGLKASADYAARLAAAKNIRHTDAVSVEKILGDEGVDGVRVRHRESDETEDIACSGVFPFIGGDPNSECVAGLVSLEDGHVPTDDALASAVPGLFAAGAVRKGYSGQLADAIDEGRRAAQAALSTF